MPRPYFWIYIYLYRMFLSRQKIYDKRDDFDFDIVNFPFLDGDIPCSTSCHMVFIFLILFELLECPVMLLTGLSGCHNTFLSSPHL